MKEENPYYCSLLWNHICVRPNYEVRPCCNFDITSYEKVYLSEDIEQTMNSSFFQNLRQKVMNKESIKGCHQCYEKEVGNTKSFRQKSNNLYTNIEPDSTLTKVENIEYLEFFIGSVCNLKCLTCYPRFSTTWVKDYKKLGWEYDTPPPPKENLDKIVNNLSSLKKIKFVGGEPLLEIQHLNILRALSKHDTSNITLEYYSNCTIWPQQEILDLWDNFKSIEIWFSIDGFKKVNDYVRFPSKWESVENTFLKFVDFTKNKNNFKLSIHTTVSVYNIWTIHQLKDWFIGHKAAHPQSPLSTILFNYVQQPEYLTLKSLPEDLKKKALNIVEKYLPEESGLIQTLKEPTPAKDYLRFVFYTKDLEKIRKIDIADHIPELAELFAAH